MEDITRLSFQNLLIPFATPSPLVQYQVTSIQGCGLVLAAAHLNWSFVDKIAERNTPWIPHRHVWKRSSLSPFKAFSLHHPASHWSYCTCSDAFSSCNYSSFLSLKLLHDVFRLTELKLTLAVVSCCNFVDYLNKSFISIKPQSDWYQSNNDNQWSFSSVSPISDLYWAPFIHRSRTIC